MTSVNYTIVAYDSDTQEYVVTYTKAGQTERVNVPVVAQDDGNVDATATVERIDALLLEIFKPAPAPVSGTADLVGTSGTATDEVESL